jgi:colicin import membrane protein
MDPAFKKALQISGGAHALLIVAMLVNFSFFDDNEVIVVPLYSASNAPLTASVVENPELKEAEKATRKKPEPKKEEPKEDLEKKQEEAKKLQAEKEVEVKKKREADIALRKKKEADKKKELEKKKADEKAKQEKKKKDELAKKKKEEDLKKKKSEELKKKKAEELKKKKAEEKKRKQELERQAEQQLMQDELAEEAEEARRAARQGQLLTEKQRYVAMIVERVRQSWFTDDTMNGKECVISLSLASNGFVINMKVEGGDTGVCNAAVNAINRVGRFPMPEDPDLNAEFRQLKLPFKK